MRHEIIHTEHDGTMVVIVSSMFDVGSPLILAIVVVTERHQHSA